MKAGNLCTPHEMYVKHLKETFGVSESAAELYIQAKETRSIHCVCKLAKVVVDKNYRRDILVDLSEKLQLSREEMDLVNHYARQGGRMDLYLAVKNSREQVLEDEAIVNMVRSQFDVQKDAAKAYVDAINHRDLVKVYHLRKLVTDWQMRRDILTELQNRLHLSRSEQEAVNRMARQDGRPDLVYSITE